LFDLVGHLAHLEGLDRELDFGEPHVCGKPSECLKPLLLEVVGAWVDEFTELAWAWNDVAVVELVEDQVL
jgi:hypothetical protein